MSTSTDPAEEARRILEVSSSRGLTLRLLGGIAIKLRCPSSQDEKLKRKYMDIDFVGLSKQSSAIRALFPEIGYSPRDRFNAMNGTKRLIFNDFSNERRVDIFLDFFEMSHKFDLRERLAIEQATLPLADLLATKLQVVEVTDKDFKDVASLLLDHEIGEGDGELINGHHIEKLCANDWGIYKTFTTNLVRLQTVVDSYGLNPSDVETVKRRARRLYQMIEDVPKSFGWKMRAKVGERMPWYEIPSTDKQLVPGYLDETSP